MKAKESLNIYLRNIEKLEYIYCLNRIFPRHWKALNINWLTVWTAASLLSIVCDVRHAVSNIHCSFPELHNLSHWTIIAHSSDADSAKCFFWASGKLLIADVLKHIFYLTCIMIAL